MPQVFHGELESLESMLFPPQTPTLDPKAYRTSVELRLVDPCTVFTPSVSHMSGFWREAFEGCR